MKRGAVSLDTDATTFEALSIADYYGVDSIVAKRIITERIQWSPAGTYQP
jgi:hypothetical protein